MTEISALEAVLRDRAFSARIKHQYGSPGADQPSRNDLQVGKQDMIDSLTSRSKAQAAALANSLTVAATLIKNAGGVHGATAPAELQLRSPKGSEGQRMRTRSPQSRASSGSSPSRSSLSRSSRSGESPRRQEGPAAGGPRGQEQRLPLPRQKQGGGGAAQQSGPVDAQQQGKLGSIKVQQQQQQQQRHAPGGPSAVMAPAAPAPAPAPAAPPLPPRPQPEASPEYWARMGRSKDQMHSSSYCYQVQAKAYHTFREWDPRVGAVQTVARPDTWRAAEPQLLQEPGPAHAGQPYAPGGSRRPMSAPVTGSSWAGPRQQDQEESDAMYGITEEDQCEGVDPALATPISSPTKSAGHMAALRARQQLQQQQQQQQRPGRPSSAPVHSFQAPLHLRLLASPNPSRPGSASLRPPSAGSEQPPARSSWRSISHHQPAAAAPLPQPRRSSSCRRSSSSRRGPDSPAGGSSESRTPPSPLSSPTLLRPTRSFLSKCVRDAPPLHTAAGVAELRPGSRTTGAGAGGVSGDVEVEPMVHFEDGGGGGCTLEGARGSPVALSPPLSPRRTSIKVPPTMLQTMLNVYENLYQYS